LILSKEQRQAIRERVKLSSYWKRYYDNETVLQLLDDMERLQQELCEYKQVRLSYRDGYERLQQENQRLREALEKAEEFIDAVTSLCGQNLQVYGWHLNGAPEPFDNLIEDDGILLDEIQALKGENHDVLSNVTTA
jgi:hypothetical protein